LPRRVGVARYRIMWEVIAVSSGLRIAIVNNKQAAL
jgi:hypothetical protein